MLADAYQRRAGTIWYFIVMIPFGEWVYFFKVKIHDPEMQQMRRKILPKKHSLAELKYNAEAVGSEHNRLLYAQALHDEEGFEEAGEIFSEIIERSPDHKAAVYGLALCQLKVGELKKAVAQLEGLVERDFGYHNYSAVADLAEAYWKLDRKDEAVALLETVTQQSQRICFKTELADYLLQRSEAEKAKELLTHALMDYQNSPAYLKSADRPWARKAKKLLKRV
jgi:thioredoxin-like negative regulator of GroEL